MKNRTFWFLAIVFTVAWAVWEMTPPRNRPLLDTFTRLAERTDPALQAIVARAGELNAAQPGREFRNLVEAVGTNDLRAYFPSLEIPAGREPNRYLLDRVQRASLGQIKLGLDLQGGMSFMVQMDATRLTESTTQAPSGTNDVAAAPDPAERAAQLERALDQAVEILRRRVDRFGVAEPIIQKAGADRILIQMPGLSESEKQQVREQIERAAFLEFRMVHPESDRLLAEGLVPPGTEILTERTRGADGRPPRQFVVFKQPERGLTGKSVVNAMAVPNPITSAPEILFELDREGARIFREITEEYQPRGNQRFYLAIVLDGELYSAPAINDVIGAGRGQITGDFDQKEAFELANALMNPLEAPVKIIEERTVGPSLGADSIRSGMIATAIAAVATFTFMIVFYFFGGLVANLALALNIVITLGAMSAVDSTLTLPGIAGIALSIGMAVDANVLIFERIREELAKGKGLKSALAAGYHRAFGTILDSHVTTLISSIILIRLGSGPVQGFGVTLTIGVAASLFTALVVTRLVFDFLLERGLMKSLRMLPMIQFTRINFMGAAKPLFLATWLVAAAGIGYGVFVRGSGVLGVDFSGGDLLTFRFTERVELDRLRQAVDAQLNYDKSLADAGQPTLQVFTEFGAGAAVEARLKEAFPAAGFELVGRDSVGPTVGAEITRAAVLASLLAMLGILVYVAFRYEFSFAVAAVVAGLHDVLFTLGIFFLSGRELGGTTVAAVLTIIGYSINDKIVILDRIREDLKLGVPGSFRSIINLALNQTLSRTLITGGAVILSTLSLYLFGGSVLNDFAFTFLVGVLAGTFSSMFVASPIVLWWNRGERPALGGPVVATAAPQPQPARA